VIPNASSVSGEGKKISCDPIEFDPVLLGPTSLETGLSPKVPGTRGTSQADTLDAF